MEKNANVTVCVNKKKDTLHPLRESKENFVEKFVDSWLQNS